MIAWIMNMLQYTGAVRIGKTEQDAVTYAREIAWAANAPWMTCTRRSMRARTCMGIEMMKGLLGGVVLACSAR